MESRTTEVCQAGCPLVTFTARARRPHAIVTTLLGASLSVLVASSSASAQQVGAGEGPDAGGRDASISPAEVAGRAVPLVDPQPPRTLASVGPRARVALNLELTGWLLVASHVPVMGFVLAPLNCRRFEGGLGSSVAPGALAGTTFAVSAALAIVGSVLRARRTRGIPRAGIPEREVLFRAPGVRGLGLAVLTLGTTGLSILSTALLIGNQCTD